MVFEAFTPCTGGARAAILRRRIVRLWTEDGTTVDGAVDAIGHVPLPPYIKRDDRLDDRDRYQTVFAHARGSIAAPTAGLHFNPSLIAALAARGVQTTAITLHVGYGTFQPVRVDRVEDHRLEPERYRSARRRAAIDARTAGHRIIAVGRPRRGRSRRMRFAHDGGIRRAKARPISSSTGLRIPIVSGLLTKSTCRARRCCARVRLAAGCRMAAYDTEIAERYRFYRYGTPC